ncbi:Zn(2+)-responsive transcriptional regulator [Shewanella avicenniae]|uniref:Zn(2+)-responsive transcriptional regulator n=1 Tax=Shewanella avicenniae TaxID=2814294 RepID=A0ABX7QTM9_9GAMM|nr:Zn(2+)-responsive transcriptional regulator [Shewanella avicenniae]QSX34028.1 Zn(2+)-responsive transcriptional regulator [Shewanella avicenniae]
MYRIGELAQRHGVNNDTLRFYEKHGLLQPSARQENGYRAYSDADDRRLAFILRAKSVGFSLSEIAELLSIEVDKANRVCSDVKELVDDKLVKVSQKIIELERFRQSLQILSDGCCGGPHSAEHCTILQALESFEENDPR